MEKYFESFVNGYTGYANYLWQEIMNPHWKNYFYWLIGVSAFFFALELIKPWRKNQPKFRKDFWLDFFYMFFNFFLFSLVAYNAASNLFVDLFKDFLALFGIRNLVAIEIASWSIWLQLLAMFVIRDFIQWWVHRLLHWSPVLWEFHKVHHSVEQMGFAAHLRYHWMETIIYRFIEYMPLAMIGFGIDDFFIVHIISLSIGHFNHSNFSFNLGPLKYVFNNPAMHIWHHAYEIPGNRKYGVNFGISLSLWDYLFGTAVIPRDGRDVKLGFPGLEKFPRHFFSQISHGFRRHRE
jgi:sterol desaturase/sphingolipid hydroxylase (fatty acid hydroxylase superfamily)